MRLYNVSIVHVFLIVLMLFATVFPVFVGRADAQTSGNYWVTVRPTTDSQMYTTVGSNWTLSFEALWSYGSSSGQPINNATVSMLVSGASEGEIKTLQLNTTMSGTFSLNYSSATADKISFMATDLKTQNGEEYNSTSIKTVEGQAFGLQSVAVTVWWDTFQVSLVNHNTDNPKTVDMSVNVTYLLLPQEGLTLPSEDTYSNQTFLPKIASGANVTINGIRAQETSAGIFSADVSTIFPTAYVLVAVSQNGWTTTYTAFSFAQKANEAFWDYAVLIGLALAAASTLTYFVLFKKQAHPAPLLSKTRFPLIGGVLLLAASIVSLYWGALAVEATSHGFNWVVLAIAGLGSFYIGVGGSLMSFKKRNEELVIFSACAPLIVNLIILKFALDAYLLPIPWLFFFASNAALVVSGLLIANSDEQFSKKAQT